MTTSVSRREFLRAGTAAGAGLTLAFMLPSCAPARRGPVTTPFKPNAWVRISTDGSVTLVLDRSEMGQGVHTALPMLLAEELDADWKDVRVEIADADKAYYHPVFQSMATGGSASVAGAWKPLREAGARARMMLIAAAATSWGVAPESCTTDKGRVRHAGSRRSLSYGELAERAALVPVPDKVVLKPAAQFRLVGTAVPRLDLADKVRGRAGFGMDVQVPGLLVATVARCPVFGGKPARWDEAAAMSVPGVKQVFPISSGIAVVAEGYWAALRGRDALGVTWDEGPGARHSTASLRREAQALSGRSGHAFKKAGSGSLGAGRRLTMEYEAPYLAHACMEPMNATAHVEADHCTVWAPTQYQCGMALGGGVQEVAAKITGLPVERVTVHTTFLGGGFGRRVMQDFVTEAVECSKRAGVPVKVIWSREDDIRHDWYRPSTLAHVAASLGPDGRPTGLTARVVCPSIIASAFGAPVTAPDDSTVEALANLPYEIPNLLVESVQPAWPVPVGFWRSVGSSQNGFVIESFIDELAWAANQDPVAYRSALLASKPRHLGVLKLAAEKAGWGSALPEGRARGVAVVESFNSFVAEVAEVSLRPDRTIQVHRVVAAVDCGIVVNPEIVKAQVESAIVFGLTAALHGKITIEGGRVVEGNFNDYPLLQLREMPVVEVHLVPSEADPTGIGEPGTPPIAPAVANAVYALTRQRIRALPLGAVPA